VDQSVERTNAHLKDVRNQLAAGLVPPSDVLSVEAQASRQTMLSVQSRSLRDSAQEQLAYLIGAPAGSALAPAGALDLGGVEDTDAAALLEDAQRQRADRAALSARVSAAVERAKAAESGRKPSVAVGAGFDYARPNSRIFPRQDKWLYSWDAGVNVNWPLFDGGRSKAELSEALASSRAVTERLAEFDRTLDLDLRQRLNESASARAAIAAAEDGVRAATEARRVIGERYAAGVATSTDVLDAQAALLQAGLDRTQALAAAHLADARLARTLGR
jgi:outer membrane protein TolC